MIGISIDAARLRYPVGKSARVQIKKSQLNI